MDAWDDHMLARFKEEGYLQKFPDQSKSKTDFENAEIWIKDVTLKTLEFFNARPHLKFIDVCIYYYYYHYYYYYLLIGMYRKCQNASTTS